MSRELVVKKARIARFFFSDPSGGVKNLHSDPPKGIVTCAGIEKWEGLKMSRGGWVLVVKNRT